MHRPLKRLCSLAVHKPNVILANSKNPVGVIMVILEYVLLQQAFRNRLSLNLSPKDPVVMKIS